MATQLVLRRGPTVRLPVEEQSAVKLAAQGKKWPWSFFCLVALSQVEVPHKSTGSLDHKMMLTLSNKIPGTLPRPQASNLHLKLRLLIYRSYFTSIVFALPTYKTYQDHCIYSINYLINCHRFVVVNYSKTGVPGPKTCAGTLSRLPPLMLICANHLQPGLHNPSIFFCLYV